MYFPTSSHRGHLHRIHHYNSITVHTSRRISADNRQQRQCGGSQSRGDGCNSAWCADGAHLCLQPASQTQTSQTQQPAAKRYKKLSKKEREAAEVRCVRSTGVFLLDSLSWDFGLWMVTLLLLE